MCWSWAFILELSVNSGDVRLDRFSSAGLHADASTSVYQEFLAKSLNDKYGNSKIEIDQIIHRANSEIDALTQRLNGLPRLTGSKSSY